MVIASENMSPEEIGRRVRKVREWNEISQQDAADRIQMARKTYAYKESGKRGGFSAYELLCIAELLKLDDINVFYGAPFTGNFRCGDWGSGQNTEYYNTENQGGDTKVYPGAGDTKLGVQGINGLAPMISRLAGDTGVEPVAGDPESPVLPLHQSPKTRLSDS